MNAANRVLEAKRVFVVEDDPINMAVIATTLKSAGAIVIQDPWNTESINRLRDVLPVDVILLDLMLRYGKSGYDTFQSLQTNPDLANIPVIIVSASDPGLEMPK